MPLNLSDQGFSAFSPYYFASVSLKSLLYLHVFLVSFSHHCYTLFLNHCALVVYNSEHLYNTVNYMFNQSVEL